MESSEIDSNFDSRSSVTNWIVAGGSIRNSITFESSLSLINDDQSDNHEFSSTATPSPKSPLILYSPSPNSAPCEITITFPQKHEVQQIYVRSTARIYEIYCNSELGSSSEYLCTVRCGIATRDEQVLHATDIEKVVCAHQRGSSKEMTEESERNGSNLNTNEDDWVEVKLLGTSPVVNGNSSLSSNTKTNEARMLQKQDLFEATAEITDANPCMSITLKLLSLQNKTCVCIDEIYVFADPVDETGLDNKPGPVENGAGSSLMAMLMPTFLELSKSKRSGLAQDNFDANKLTRQKSVAIKEESSDRIDAENKVSNAGKTNEEAMPISEPAEVEIPRQVSDMPHGRHIEAVLNQLVSRVNRIEDLFLKFENSMLNPIRSIDERLQKVEQNLENLTKKTRDSQSLSCTRITAPEFSCSESETNSLYNSGCVDLGDTISEANKKDSVPAMAAITTDMNPSHIITDDVEDYNTTEPSEEISRENRANSVSIDDALASALARFVSSTSVQYSKVLSVKAPDFLNEEEGNDNKDKVASTEPPNCSGEFEETERVATLSISSSEDIDEIETVSPNNEKFAEMEEGDKTRKTTYSDQFLEDRTNSDSENTQDLDASTTSIPHTELTVLDSVAEFRNSVLKVDFEIPILEVKFTCEKNLDAKSPLEALLAGIPDLKDEDNSEKEICEDSFQTEDREFSLIPVDDFEQMVSATVNEISIDADYYSLTALPLSAEEGIVHLI